MTKFNVLLGEVQSALLFASQDESRYVLNSVLFELRPGKQPVMISTDGRRLAVIETAAPQLADDELPAIDAVLSSTVLSSVCKFAPLKSKIHALTIELHPPTRAVFSIPDVAVDVEKGAMIDGNYPKWRCVVPTGDKQPISRLALNSDYIGDFSKTAKFLDCDPMIRMNIFSAEGSIEVHIEGRPNFYGVVCPLEDDKSERNWQPQFLGLATA